MRFRATLTSLREGRRVAREKLVPSSEMVRLLDDFFASETGYLEVSGEDAYYPALLVGFRGDLATVQCIWEPELMALLLGDGSVAASEPVDVLIMDELATFTGEYVSSCARAREILLDFATGADIRGLDWHDL